MEEEPAVPRFMGCSAYPAMTLYLEPNAHHHKVNFSGKTDRWKLVQCACLPRLTGPLGGLGLGEKG